MHKKILRSVSVLLTTALLFSIICCAPFSASAAETDDADAVAAADVYDSFGELTNGKYTLESQTYALTEDFTAEGYLYIPSGVEATIDLNGKTLARELTAASDDGSVIRNEGTLTVKDSTGFNSGRITGGNATEGGAIRNAGVLTIEGGTLENNRAQNAGAVYNAENAVLTVTGGVFNNNTATTDGGAFVNFGVMTLQGGTISGNTAAHNGGGICNDGTLNLTSGSVTGNAAGEKGSGVFNDQDGVLNAQGAPVIWNNTGQNLYLDGSSVINVTGILANGTHLDVATDSHRAVTSGYGENSGYYLPSENDRITFANGHTAATNDGHNEVIADIGSPQMIADWNALDSAIYNHTGDIQLALSADIVNNTSNKHRIHVQSGANVTLDLCGHDIDMNCTNSSSSDQGFFMLVNGGTVTVEDSCGSGTITGGNAANGGAFEVSNGGTLNLYGVTLADNKVSSAGGAVWNSANVNIDGAVIKNNTADSVGGAVYVEENANTLTIAHSLITGNTATGNGGAIYQNGYNHNVATVITDCRIDGNTQSGSGGGGAIYLKKGSISMTGGSVSDNTANDAGAVKLLTGTSFTAEGVAIDGNESRNAGAGAIANEGILSLTDCTVNGNTAKSDGGALYNLSADGGDTATLIDTTFNGNTSTTGYGGALYVKKGAVSVVDCSVDDNAAQYGGGVYLDASDSSVSLNATDTTFNRNTAAQKGGGIVDNRYANLYQCEISENTAGSDGGGIWCYGSANLQQCTINDNTSGGNGGGVFVDSSGSVSVNTSRITGNTATGNGGGIYVHNSAAGLTVSGQLTVTGNATGNVYLSGSQKINIGSLYDTSQIGVTAQTYERNLTSGLNAADASALELFELDEEDNTSFDVVKELNGTEMKVTRTDKVMVNSWEALQTAITNATRYETVITLEQDITSATDQNRIEIGSGRRIAINLNGKTLKAVRSERGKDGHVIEVHSGGTLTIRDSVGGGKITGGNAKRGGGINVNENGSLTLKGGSVTGNKAEDGGGIYINDEAKSFKMTGGSVTENEASDEGGGIDAENSITITGGSVSKNKAQYGGGIYYDEGGETLSVTGAYITNNYAGKQGGGIYIWHGIVELTNCFVRDNSGITGGAIYNTDDCTFKATGTTFEKNKAVNYGGGAIVNYGTAVLTNCVLTNNASQKNGGAIFTDDDLTLTDCTITKNKATDGTGGAIYLSDGDLHLDSGEISKNWAAHNGGGIYYGDDADHFTIRGSAVVRDNEANNIYLPNGKKLEVTGPMTAGAATGVSVEKYTATFTTGYKAQNGTEDPILYFFAEPGSAVTYDSKGEAMVVESEWTYLRNQIKNAENGAIIRLDRDWTATDKDFRLTVAEGKTVTLDLNGHTIDGKKVIGSVFEVNGTLTVKDSSLNKGVITGGKSDKGGAFLNNGTLFIQGGTVKENTATFGGAVYNNGTLSISGGVFENNEASDKGGVVYNDGTATATISGGTFESNLAKAQGGAIYINKGDVTLTGGRLLSNTAYTYGGAVYINEGTLNFYGGEISSNAAVREAGGIDVGLSGTLNVGYGPVIKDNNAPVGKNILLNANKVINITERLYTSAKLDVVTKNTSNPLTNGFEAHGSVTTAFTYNNGTSELQEQDGELICRPLNASQQVDTWQALQNAINNSTSEDDVIVVSADLQANGRDALTVNNKEVTIELNGHTIDRQLTDDEDDGEVFWVKGSGKLTLTDRAGTAVITGGYNDDEGGGIVIDENATCVIKGGSVQGNRSDEYGGGIFVEGSLIMEGGAVSFNHADEAGGGISTTTNIQKTEDVLIQLENALITGNTADHGGGGLALGIDNDASYISNCVISNNKTTKDYGGGLTITVTDHQLVIEDTVISGNTAPVLGGGVTLVFGTLVMNDCTVTRNTSADGAGVYENASLRGLGLNYTTEFRATGTEFSYNTSTKHGAAGINCRSKMTLTNCKVNRNSAKEQGGGIYICSIDDTVTITDSEINYNYTGTNGGGIALIDGKLDISDSSVSYNDSLKNGGGIFQNKKNLGVEATNVSIDHNEAGISKPNNDSIDGGGVYLKKGQMKLHGGSVSNNWSRYEGGAAFVCEDTTLEIDGNAVIDSNRADKRGGAIKVEEDGALTLEDCTVSNNYAPENTIEMYEDITLKGALTFTGNRPEDIFLKSGKRIKLAEKISVGENPIRVTLEDDTGVFTRDYSKYFTDADNSSIILDPGNIFAAQEGYGVKYDYKKKEAVVKSTDWADLQRLVDEAEGTLTLERDFCADSSDEPITIGSKNITIDLNGHTIDGGNAIMILNLTSTASLTLKDSKGTGAITNGKSLTAGAVMIGSNAVLSIQGAKITNCTGMNGGAICNNGILYLRSGEITGNTSDENGGGICNNYILVIRPGTFTISGNTAKGSGGGIYNTHSLLLEGGTITENTALKDGGGVMVTSSSTLLTRYAPVVTGNNGSSGKNIMLDTGARIQLEDIDAEARLDLATRDIYNPLTIGYETSGATLDNFSYNEDDDVEFAISLYDHELYYPALETLNADVWVDSWSALQAEINSADSTTEKVIGLSASLGAEGSRRIVVDNKKVTIDLAGYMMDRHLTDDDNEGSVIKVTNGAVLTIKDSAETGVITGGYDEDDGGGIYISDGGKCIIEGGTIRDNKADVDGGGVSVNNGTLIMTGGAIVHNRAGDTGGAVYISEDGTVDLKNALFADNSAKNEGGAFNMHLDDNASSIENCVIRDNSSDTDRGGAIVKKDNGTLTIKNTVITDNFASDDGGGIYIEAGNVTMTGGEVSHNSGEEGGGVKLTSSTRFTANGVSVSYNEARTEDSGGISNDGKLTLTDCHVNYNKSAANGGGIYSMRSDAVFTNTEIKGNLAKKNGGGIYVDDGEVTLNDCTIAENSSVYGGGVYVDDKLTATNTVFNGNTTTSKIDPLSPYFTLGWDDVSYSLENTSSSENGGAIANVGEVTLTSCTFTDNKAKSNGGAVWSNDKLTVDGCTFTGNEASDEHGGAICVNYGDLLMKGANTVKNNTANTYGAGICILKNAESIKVQGTPVIDENNGSNLYLSADKKLQLSGALQQGARVSISMKSDIGVFTDGFSNYNSNPQAFFVSDEMYEVYKSGNEGALRIPEEDENAFIDRNNRIEDPEKVTGKNWMSAISGERYINEINLNRAHDASMNRVKTTNMSSWIRSLLSETIVMSPIAIAFCAMLPLAILTTVALFPAAMTALYVFRDKTEQCARTQYRYIDEQMEDGVRNFDMRINNRTYGDWWSSEQGDDDGVNLYHCHGKDPSGGTIYGLDHEGKELTLNKVLEWTKEFLKKHPTETIYMEFTVESVSADKDYDTCYKRLKEIMRKFSYEVNPSTGKPYLYMEDRTFGKKLTHWPKLKECRGQLFISPETNDFIAGYSWGVSKSYGGSRGSVVDPPQNLISQVKAGLDECPPPRILTDALVHRTIQTGYFINTTDDPGKLIYTNPPLELEHQILYGGKNGEYAGLITETEDGACFNQKGEYIGRFSIDGVTQKECNMIWKSNFYDAIQYRTIKVHSGIAGDEEVKTYRVLKGTKITIPENIYTPPADGENNHFLNWSVTSGDNGDRSPDYAVDNIPENRSDKRDFILAQTYEEPLDGAIIMNTRETRTVEPGDVLCVYDDLDVTAQWGPTVRTPLEIVWKDCDDVDALREDRLTLNITYANDSEIHETTLYASENWKTAVTGEIVSIIPEWEQIHVSAQKPYGDEQNGYRYELSYDELKGYKVTLYHHAASKTVYAAGTITWEDDNDHYGRRPDSVTVNLYKTVKSSDGNATTLVGSMAVRENAAGLWTYDFGTRDLYEDYENVLYSVQEEPVSLYSIAVDDFNITNTYDNPETRLLTYEVNWKDSSNAFGERPSNVTLVLKDRGVEIDRKVVDMSLSEQNANIGTFDVKEYEESHLGEEFSYTIEEEGLPACYTAEYTTEDGAYIINNTLNTADKYFKGHSLSLNGDIGVNFYIDLKGADPATDNAKVNFTWFDKELNVTITPDMYVAGRGYKVSCPVAAAETTYDVTAKLSIGGEEKETNVYSVYRYANSVLLNNDFRSSFINSLMDEGATETEAVEKYDQLLALLLSMLDYSTKSQKYFNRNISVLANTGTDFYDNSDITPDSIKSSPSNMSKGLEAYGLEYQKTTIVLNSGTILKHYYKVVDQEKFDAVKNTITFDGAPVSFVTRTDTGMIYFQKCDIAAMLLDHQYELQIGENAYRYSVMDNIKSKMLASEDEKTIAICKAIYRYNEAAKAYFD